MKKLKRKVLEIAILLTVVSSILPFFCNDVYADTTVPVTYNSSSTQIQWSSHIHVTNYCESPLQGSTPCKLTFTLDDNYYGMISFDGYAGSSLALSYVTVFVAGGIGEYNYRTFSNANPMYINSINIMGVGLTIPDSNIDLSLIEQLLTSINNHEQTIENTEILSNNYLKIIQNKYDVAIESLPFIVDCLQSLEVVDFNDITFTKYPIFKVTNGDVFARFISSTAQAYDDHWLVAWVSNGWSLSNLRARFVLADGQIAEQGRLQTAKIGNTTWQLLRMTLSGYTVQTNPNTITYNYSEDMYFIPIYLQPKEITNYGTDFAMNYGLPNNRELQYLEKIAEGTTESNISSSELENNASDFDDVAGDVYNLENTFNTGLNNSLQQIDTSFDVGNTFGSKFLLAADWVRVQFNTITASNPFGTLLSFSLLLGVALLIIGKVLG